MSENVLSLIMLPVVNCFQYSPGFITYSNISLLFIFFHVIFSVLCHIHNSEASNSV